MSASSSTLPSQTNQEKFISACHSVELDAIKTCWESASQTERNFFISFSDYFVLTRACREGRSDIIELLFDHASEAQIAAMLASQEYVGFKLACKYGHADIIELLFRAAGPVKKQLLLKADEYAGFKLACKHGHIGVVKLLLRKTYDSQKNTMLTAKACGGFVWACNNGYTNIVRLLLKSPTQKKYITELLEAQNYDALRWASAMGHTEIVRLLLNAATKKQQAEMIKAQAYLGYLGACANGHIEVVRLLLDNTNLEQRKELLKARGFGGFGWACEIGHTDLVRLLLGATTKKQKNELLTSNWFLAACKHGHSGTIKYLIDTASLKQKNKMLTTLGLSRLIQVHKNGHFETFKALLQAASPEYQMKVLHHLIQKNNPNDIPFIAWLLEKPSIRNQLIAPESSLQRNTLLRLARKNGNYLAAIELMNIPVVLMHAKKYGFYQNELSDNLPDVAGQSRRTIASNHEKIRLIGRLKAHYLPHLRRMDDLKDPFNSLKESLKKQYEDTPASITIDGNTITLPFDYGDFRQLMNRLSLSDAMSKVAYEAYYKHEAHTAYRYLSKPNYWMSSEAGHYTDDGNNNRWSYFETHIDLIILFWLAAKDTELKPTNGFSVEDRVSLFIKQLALIGRAHNWREGSDGIPCDDMEGDKPNCQVWAVQMLFQSVLGHPLLENELTEELLRQSINSFVQAHMSTAIDEYTANGGDLSELDKDYKAESIHLKKPTERLIGFNISPAKQRTLLSNLAARWGESFTQNLALINSVREAFNPSIEPGKSSQSSDLVRLNHPSCRLDRLIANKLAASRLSHDASVPSVPLVFSQRSASSPPPPANANETHPRHRLRSS